MEVEPTTRQAPLQGVALVIDKATNSLKGLQIVLGLLTFPQEKLKVFLQTTSGAALIEPGQPLAQALHWPTVADYRGKQGIHLAALTMTLDNQPICALTIKGKTIRGLLDTGADVSIIARKNWPSSWPLQESDNTLVGLGMMEVPPRSAEVLEWQDEEQHKGQFQPYVCNLPITLWGREVLVQLGLTLTDGDSKADVGWQMMAKMGCKQGGLGKHGQGAVEPIKAKQRKDRSGLGFQKGPLNSSQFP